MRRLLHVAWLCFAGCNFGPGGLGALENACGGPADCAIGVCAQGICVDDVAEVSRLVVEVVRSPSDSQGTTPSSWFFEQETFTGTSTRDYVLPPTKEVLGLVRWGGLRVPAKVRFSRKVDASLLPLAPDPVEATTLRDPAADTTGGSFDYTTRLVAGEHYQVVVEPSGDMVATPQGMPVPALRIFPPRYIDDVEIGAGEGAFRLDLEYPVELIVDCTPQLLTGCTLSGQVLSTDGATEVSEPGLQIRAVEKDSGRVVSSVGETDASGNFVIRTSHDASDYVLSIASSAGAASAFPTVAVDLDFLFPEDPMLRVLVPRLSTLRFTSGVRDASGNPIPNASLRFSSDSVFGDASLLIQGSFTASTTSDDGGDFAADLLPGLYVVVVTPPEDANNTWGVLTRQIFIAEGEDPSGTPMVVPTQTRLSGSVTTFTEEPAVGVTIQVTSRAANRALEVYRSQQTVSDGAGLFSMTADEGLYDFHISPPAGSGFGWVAEPDLSIGLSVGDVTRDVMLVPPIQIRGQVLNSMEGPAVGSRLRAYLFVESELGLRPIQVAEATVDAAGRYRLLISPPDVAQ